MNKIKKRFERPPHILRLAERDPGFLQVLLPEFGLTKKGSGLCLDLTIDANCLSIADGQGKRQLSKAIGTGSSKARKKLKAKLSSFRKDDRFLSYRFDCSRFPFRWANGGVLPILRYRGKDYFCLFYRDIPPIGWNIANGSSDTIDEMLKPWKIVLREFGEEIFFYDVKAGVIYTHDPGTKVRPIGFQRRAREKWDRSFKKREGLKGLKEQSLPLVWIEGPDRVRATLRRQERATRGDSPSARPGKSWQRRYVTKGYFLSVTPQDNGIEVDRIARINLDVGGEIRLVDGELRDGQVLNRVVGLFEVTGFKKRLKTHDFRPDIHFHDGIERLGRAEFKRSVKTYLKDLEKRKLRDPKSIKRNRDARPRFDLCPITRSVIQRYFDWTAAQKEPDPDAEAKDLRARARDCEVFLCHSSKDTRMARWLFDDLRRRGVRPFFSPISLPRLGASDFAETIHTALEKARCMVVVASRADHLDSGWVQYEWNSFHNEILSGRKHTADLLTFLENVEAEDLPYALRQRQMVSFSAASPQDSFDVLASYINRGG